MAHASERAAVETDHISSRSHLNFSASDFAFSRAARSQARNAMITLVFADDHAVTRAGIRAVLSAAPDIQIVGEADNGSEVMHLVERLRPQILLLDLIMPGPPPAEIERWVRQNCPETATLVLTAHDRDAYLSSMMEAGAVGLLNKGSDPERLVGAIRRAASGEFLFDGDQLKRVQRWRESAGEKWKSLGKRERQILKLLAQGIDRAEIALQMEVVPKTVDYHLSKLHKKLGVKTSKEAIGWFNQYLPEDLVENTS
jgi:DNA-binding NarL/FixJ family response regulator